MIDMPLGKRARRAATPSITTDPNETRGVVVPILSLPNEVICMIVDEILSDRDVLSLIATNKRLNSVVGFHFLKSRTSFDTDSRGVSIGHHSRPSFDILRRALLSVLGCLDGASYMFCSIGSLELVHVLSILRRIPKRTILSSFQIDISLTSFWSYSSRVNDLICQLFHQLSQRKCQALLLNVRQLPGLSTTSLKPIKASPLTTLDDVRFGKYFFARPFDRWITNSLNQSHVTKLRIPYIRYLDQFLPKLQLRHLSNFGFDSEDASLLAKDRDALQSFFRRHPSITLLDMSRTSMSPQNPNLKSFEDHDVLQSMVVLHVSSSLVPFLFASKTSLPSVQDIALYFPDKSLLEKALEVLSNRQRIISKVAIHTGGSSTAIFQQSNNQARVASLSSVTTLDIYFWLGSTKTENLPQVLASWINRAFPDVKDLGMHFTYWDDRRRLHFLKQVKRTCPSVEKVVIDWTDMTERFDVLER
ncbi:hypothetical protein VKT23_014137 [Stygiomarasmius scandens]|uniref:F-box domain-containing protein n=1 Tax=Marasmiellus scandens TaxID=2682957 RepID=A0ABR1J1E1_9AGAR